jgi:hypothetical protein
MYYQIRNSKDTNSVELKYTDMDGSVDKTKLNVYEDGSDEEFLKLIKEFNTSTHNTPRSRSNSQTRDSNSDYEYHAITSQKEKGKISEHTPSSEILVALPDANNPKKYTTYLGLVDSGSSGSLINKKLVAKENMQTQLRHTKWETATGVLLTQGKSGNQAMPSPAVHHETKHHSHLSHVQKTLK